MQTQAISEPVPQELVWTPEMVSRFWAQERRNPENFFSYQVSAVIARRFRQYLKRNAEIVDVGAGGGFLVEDLLAYSHRCAAIEVGADNVDELNKKFQTFPSFLGARRMDDLKPWQSQFDVAFLIEVVEHLYDDDLRSCLASVRGLLRPGGLLIVTTPNEENRSRHFICSPESGRLFHRFQHVRSWSAASLAATLAANGLECLEGKPTNFNVSIDAERRTAGLPLRLARLARRLFSADTPHLYAIARKVSADLRDV
jgi:2-polyprenyl-3-methyl-5-hydroxy-6-metoxy-1,4-benzoquinol methylase